MSVDYLVDYPVALFTDYCTQPDLPYAAAATTAATALAVGEDDDRFQVRTGKWTEVLLSQIY
jgi:hypothetical protein